MRMLAHYDARNPLALRKLIAGGARSVSFPRSDGRGVQRLPQELWAELSAKNPDFAAIFPDWKKFQAEQAGWFRVAESPLDNYLRRRGGPGKVSRAGQRES